MKIETYLVKLKNCPGCLEYTVRALNIKHAKQKAKAWIKDINDYEFKLKS